MSVRLLIPGQREPTSLHTGALRSASAEAADKPVTDLLDAVEVVHAFSQSPAARSARQDAPEAIEVEDDDVLEIELEDGFTIWTSAERYRRQAEQLDPDAITAEGLRLGAIAHPSAAERGVKEWVSSALRVLRLKPDRILEDLKDPRKWPDFIKELVQGKAEQLGAWATAKLLMYFIESRLTPGPGLYRWAGAGLGDLERTKELTAADLPQGRPLLVFIHGTASRTLGSFGALGTAEASLHWRQLRDTFGEHIYAFEHRTLSDSPIENAIALLHALPEGAHLNLVTHSRGGLVGDLLCLRELTEAQIGAYRRQSEDGERDLDPADAHDQAQLQRLADLLKAKAPRVLRYARVACPARGTLLASDNIDEFLSILTNLIGLIPALGASPIYHVIKRVTLEVAKQRLEPTMIPGIEAMIPTSPLVALLNHARQAQGTLGVIAGDLEGGNWLKRLGTFVADRFIYEGRDNDLVVNTDSMFHGAHRPVAHYVFQQGSTVNHFNYFRNDPTRTALLRWLTEPGDRVPIGFEPVEYGGTQPIPTLRSIQKHAAAAQPVVFVLPGIMGSQLERNGNRIWLDYFDLLRGGLGRLRKPDDPQVWAAGLIGDYYEALCRELANTHEVIPFAYDWRRSVRQAGAELAKAVEKTLASSHQPIRFVAHSMGGLVVRAFIAQQPKLWEQVRSRSGSRILMLGTPNRGAHSTVENLLGLGATVRQLALLDTAHNLQQVLDILAGFPGLLELLPQKNGDGLDWFSPAVWSELRKVNRDLGATPSASLLREAHAALASLPLEIPGADRVIYVAGVAPSTVSRVEVDARGRLIVETTDAGDGRVTHAAGRLPGVPTWYMDAAHGDLANHAPSFPAILQLLEEGRTNQLPATPPGTARGVTTKLPYVPQSVLYPTQAELTAGLMGRRVRTYRAAKRAGFRISVVHGDLRNAKYPVMVGHYEGDTIVGAEAQLDRRLAGALAQRYALGIYPGALGTNAVVLRPQDALQQQLGIPRGAIVIGLGTMGDLSPGTLANAIRRGALDYVALLEDQAPGPTQEPDGRLGQREAGLSVLLLGTNSSANITIDDSVSAVLRGVAQANHEIGNPKTSSTRPFGTRISEVQIVELFGDVAIHAAHALKERAPDISAELDIPIQAEETLRETQGGLVRLTPNLARDQWRRWIITAEPAPGRRTGAPALPAPLIERVRHTLADAAQVDAASWKAVLSLAFPELEPGPSELAALHYVALGDRARAEVRAQQGQPELIDRLVRLSIRDTRFKPETARTLFELLIPNELKDSLPQQSRVVMVVDAETATYPWELMASGGRPICVDTGLVRQLQTAVFRGQIRASTANTAYVVGEPLTAEGVPPLPAAREEARQVTALLGGRFQVTFHPERPSALEVLEGLFARPYRIVHVAGHGYFSPPEGNEAKARSGVLLEDGLYLTAAEIAQMRQVPDLVFLNCCHLAQVGPQTPPGAAVAFNRLAASISRELIEMGVRAVVAAGWAVRDDAASVFARRFYEQMLAGEAFGAALLEARRRTWRQFPDCNTWGAYQAYGDPGFRLFPTTAHADAAFGQSFVAPAELIRELLYHRESVGVAKLIERCPPNWLKRGDVLSAIGTAFSRTRDFARASEFLAQALEDEDEEGRVRLKAVEQLGNLETRWGEQSGQPELIQRGTSRLKTLCDLAETGERLALVGSAYKRLVQITQGQAMNAALGEAAAWYKKAADHKLAEGEVDPYPVLNWLTLEAVRGRSPADAPHWLARARAAAQERFAVSRRFWDAVAIPDAALVERLLGETTERLAADSIAGQYRTAFAEAQARADERDSVTNQLKFLERVLTELGEAGPKRALPLVARIQTLLVEPQATPEQRRPPPSASVEPPTRPSSPRKPSRPRRRPGMS